MPPNDHPDHLLRWCATLIRSFNRSGINRIFISPGSRSTPLVYAAARHPQIKKHIVLDERSAGFQALGTAKSSGNPAVLICTSGTAAANYYPAVIEARQSGTPLIVCSADRTSLERNTGANQTINQLNLFGSFPVFFHDAGEPGDQPEDFDRADLLARQAVDESVTKAGPVHLNFPFRKPLEPSKQALDHLTSFYQETKELEEKRSWGSIEPPDWLHELLNRARRPVIICGPIRTHDPLLPTIVDLSRIQNIPILAESASLHIPAERIYPAASGWVDKLETHPDLILRFGGMPTSRGMINFLNSAAGINRIDFRSTYFPSEQPGSEYRIFHADRPVNFSQIESRSAGIQVDACNRAFANYNTFYHELISGTEGLTDQQAIDAALNQADGTLVLSNSLIVRDADRVPVHKFPDKVITNRGASGIDGVTSTAIGAAVSGDPTTLITGDLAFLHDLTALLSAGEFNGDLHVVVINNQGGRIFRMLPFEAYDEEFSEYFETPQSADNSQLCRGFGISYRRISGKVEMPRVLEHQLDESGIRVTEVITDPIESERLRKKLAADG